MAKAYFAASKFLKPKVVLHVRGAALLRSTMCDRAKQLYARLVWLIYTVFVPQLEAVRVWSVTLDGACD